jgi:hypothetical protein
VCPNAFQCDPQYVIALRHTLKSALAGVSMCFQAKLLFQVYAPNVRGCTCAWCQPRHERQPDIHVLQRVLR